MIKNPLHCTGQAETEHPRVTKEILTSSAGQLALELGVAHDLLTEYECTGRKDFDDEFVRKCKRGMDRAAHAIANLANTNDLTASMHALFEAMQERERRLFAKFAGKLEARLF